MPHGIPSHDTFGEVFSRLDPVHQQRFMAWTQAVAELAPGEVVAIDGKTVRRSHDRNSGKRAIHLVSAWASANTLTLGQVKTGKKSNEITAKVAHNLLKREKSLKAGIQGKRLHLLIGKARPLCRMLSPPQLTRENTRRIPQNRSLVML